MISNPHIKGSLTTIILKILKDEGPLHGYAIAKKIETLTNGKLTLAKGSLYSILYKLKKEKWLVTATEINMNRIRIYHSLTPKGHEMADRKISELKKSLESLNIFVNK